MHDVLFFRLIKCIIQAFKVHFFTIFTKKSEIFYKY